MKAAKLFRTGGSVAVRIPKAWVQGVSEVNLERKGDAIVVHPHQRTLKELAEECGRLDGDFPDRLPQGKSGVRADSEGQG